MVEELPCVSSLATLGLMKKIPWNQFSSEGHHLAITVPLPWLGSRLQNVMGDVPIERFPCKLSVLLLTAGPFPPQQRMHPHLDVLVGQGIQPPNTSPCAALLQRRELWCRVGTKGLFSGPSCWLQWRMPGQIYLFLICLSPRNSPEMEALLVSPGCMTLVPSPSALLVSSQFVSEGWSFPTAPSGHQQGSSLLPLCSGQARCPSDCGLQLLCQLGLKLARSTPLARRHKDDRHPGTSCCSDRWHQVGCTALLFGGDFIVVRKSYFPGFVLQHCEK